jgi:hypothetical protein
MPGLMLFCNAHRNLQIQISKQQALHATVNGNAQCGSDDISILLCSVLLDFKILAYYHSRTAVLQAWR